jgi:hypothetical protein
MSYNNGVATFKAGTALEARRRVKIESGTTNDPPEIVYADAGEDYIGVTEYAVADGDMVAVKMCNAPGIFEIECLVDSAIARGTTLYGAADGRVSDASSGTAQAIALETGVDYKHIRCAMWNVKSTTAATVSVADSGGFTSTATVEAALAEIYQHIASAQKCIPIPLGSLTLEDGTAIGKFSDGDSATPGLSQESNKEVVLRWNNHGTPGKVAAAGIALPPDLDAASDVVIHWRAKMSGTTDTPTLEHECYLGAGDTDCAGTDDEVDGGATLTEYTATIAASNVGGSPEELTLLFGPKASELGTDDLLVYSVWIEYTGKTLTA